MNKSFLLALVASTALATGAMAQSSGTDTDSSQTTTGTGGSTITPDTSPSTSTTGSTGSGTAGTTGSTASGSTGTSGSGTTADPDIAGQNPNPNIYGGNQQSGSADNRFAQQNQPPYGQSGQGMHPWGMGGHPGMMSGMMQGMMQHGMGMVCVTPAPSAPGMGVPGSFACFPSQQMGQMGMGGMGMGGMGGMGMGGMGGQQQMGQYGFDPYGRRFDDSQNRYGWDRRGYGYDQQYGRNTGPYDYGNRYGSSYDSGPSSPNWYYENRQRQFSRSDRDYDRDRYGPDYGTSRSDDRSGQYDGDTTGSMSRPYSGGSDNRSNDSSPQRYYDDSRSN